MQHFTTSNLPLRSLRAANCKELTIKLAMLSHPICCHSGGPERHLALKAPLSDSNYWHFHSACLGNADSDTQFFDVIQIQYNTAYFLISQNSEPPSFQMSGHLHESTATNCSADHIRRKEAVTFLKFDERQSQQPVLNGPSMRFILRARAKSHASEKAAHAARRLRACH